MINLVELDTLTFIQQVIRELFTSEPLLQKYDTSVEIDWIPGKSMSEDVIILVQGRDLGLQEFGGTVFGKEVELALTVITKTKSVGSRISPIILEELLKYNFNVEEMVKRKDIDKNHEGSELEMTALILRATMFTGIRTTTEIY